MIRCDSFSLWLEYSVSGLQEVKKDKQASGVLEAGQVQRSRHSLPTPCGSDEAFLLTRPGLLSYNCQRIQPQSPNKQSSHPLLRCLFGFLHDFDRQPDRALRFSFLHTAESHPSCMLVARNLASRSIKWRAPSSQLCHPHTARVASRITLFSCLEHSSRTFYTTRTSMSQEETAAAQAGEQQHLPRPVHTTQHAASPSEAISANGAPAPAPAAGASSSKKPPKPEKKAKKGDDLATNMAALEVCG